MHTRARLALPTDFETPPFADRDELRSQIRVRSAGSRNPALARTGEPTACDIVQVSGSFFQKRGSTGRKCNVGMAGQSRFLRRGSGGNFGQTPLCAGDFIVRISVELSKRGVDRFSVIIYCPLVLRIHTLGDEVCC